MLVRPQEIRRHLEYEARLPVAAAPDAATVLESLRHLQPSWSDFRQAVTVSTYFDTAEYGLRRAGVQLKLITGLRSPLHWWMLKSRVDWRPPFLGCSELGNAHEATARPPSIPVELGEPLRGLAGYSCLESLTPFAQLSQRRLKSRLHDDRAWLEISLDEVVDAANDRSFRFIELEVSNSSLVRDSRTRSTLGVIAESARHDGFSPRTKLEHVLAARPGQDLA